MSKRVIVISAVVVILTAAGLIYQTLLNRQTLSDEQQILDLIETAQLAVERTDVRGTMSVVSRNYKDSIGLTYPSLRMKVADGLRSGMRPDVIIENPAISVRGDEATAHLWVRVVDRREGESALVNTDFILHLNRETVRRHLIFATQQWRVVSVEGLSGVLESH